MWALNLKSGVPYFICILSSSKEMLSSAIFFAIRKNNKKDPVEYLLSPEEDNKDECLESLYKKLNKKLNSLELKHPSVKESFYLYVYANWVK